MRVEYRQSTRHDTATQVTIAYPPLGVVNARMTNLSNEGLHVDTGLIQLHVGQPVEIFFQLSDGRVCGLKAETIHTHQQGTGLRFVRDEAVRVLDSIQHPLYTAA
jgi:hypothetical protein